MVTLRADEIFPDLLGALAQPAEIVDTAGAVLGRFIPDPERVRQLYEESAPPFDPAELERRKAPGRNSYTTRQVFEYLKSITPDEETRAYLQQKIDALPA